MAPSEPSAPVPPGDSTRDPRIEVLCDPTSPERKTVDLRGIRAPGLDLSEVDLSGLDLSEADLSGADLHGATLCGTRLVDADLSGADLTGAELMRADLGGANLSRCRASRAGFGASRLAESVLSEASLQDSTFSQADLRGADLRFADLQRARLRECDLAGADVTRADLREAILVDAKVADACFDGADLRQASLARLSGHKSAGWIGADVREADFRDGLLLRRFILDENYLHEFRRQGRSAEWVYRLWKLTSDCGRSVTRWALSTLVLVLVFAGLYRLVEIDWGDYETPLSPVYFSIVTLTTLGYGDVLPASTAGQIATIAQVIVGYMALGGLISIFANKMARRAD